MIFLFKMPFTFWFNRLFSLILFIFLFSVSSLAWSLPEPGWPEIVTCIDPYLGIDMGLRRMAWKKDYGDNVYKHVAYQPNIYTGLKFNQFFGIEVGYEEILFKKRDTAFTEGTSIILGVDFAPPIAIRSSVKLKGWHFNIVGTYPLEWCEYKCIELLGTMGIASLKTTQQTTFLLDETGILPSPDVFTFSKRKIVPRVSAGFQYKITDHCGLRFILIGIENTSLLGDLGLPQEAPESARRTKMKHNTYHSIGFLLHF